MRAELLPEAFAGNMRALLGDEEYTSYIESFEEDWKPGLRANGLKISPEELKAMLPWRLEPVPWAASGFYYEADQARPAKHPAYYAGLYYLQEPSAMTPGEMLPVEPGDRVLDLCAAPGGKSTQLGARLQGRGLLVSNDISNSRARALLKNLELAGVPNICVTSESPNKLSQAFPEFFDKILVDAPCSGEGMFRRDSDMVKDWSSRGPAYYGPLQREILAAAVAMLRPGGYILYSTCTFSREEDEETVAFALERFPDLQLVPLDAGRVPGACGGIGLDKCMRLFPHRIKGEGHFLALMRKAEPDCEKARDAGGMTRGGASAGGRDSARAGSAAGDCAPARAGNAAGDCASARAGNAAGGCAPARPESGAGAAATSRGRDSARSSRRRGKREGGAAESAEGREEMERFLGQIAMPMPEERLSVRPEGVYLLPEGMERPPSLRFLRTGLLLGELKKGRFEPSQALAMALKKEQYPLTVDFSLEDERVIRYLKGETVSLSGGEEPVKGWCLVCAGGYPLGWAKGSGMTLKNKYYPGWRWQ
ncbi:MAG: RsmB/NOP family class I SAM-dependent RNA methyltransferase [Enterocloster asparagiformis]|nr:RsmB/NOP family class I SAM-dependent RNA methyltransferase [Enterocloster asparagiformis]